MDDELKKLIDAFSAEYWGEKIEAMDFDTIKEYIIQSYYLGYKTGQENPEKL